MVLLVPRKLRRVSDEQEDVQVRTYMCEVCTNTNCINNFNIDFELINYIAGTSFLTMIPMYISSYVYKFCEYHRMFLHYIVVTKVVMMIDLYIGIPLGDFMLLVLYLIIAGIFAFLALYLHQKYGGRKND